MARGVRSAGGLHEVEPKQVVGDKRGGFLLSRRVFNFPLYCMVDGLKYQPGGELGLVT